MTVQTNRLVYLFAFIILLVYFFVYAVSPLVDHDPAIYTIIGRAFILDGIAPYGYVFDHKPIAIYYIYGLLSLIYPFKTGFFAFSSMAFIIGIAVFINRKTLKFGDLILSCLAICACTAFSYQLSGNTELFSAAFIILSIGSMTNYSKKDAFLSGIFCCIAFNINYLSSICLLLPTLHYFFKLLKKSRWENILIYSAGFAACFLLLLLPVVVLGGTSALVEYVAMQYTFIANYGKYSMPLYSSAIYFMGMVSSFIPVMYASLRSNLSLKSFTPYLLCLPGCYLAAISSGYKYQHYFTFFAVIMSLFVIHLMKENGIKATILLAFPVLFMSINDTINRAPLMISRFVDFNIKGIDSRFDELSSIVGDKKVLPIRSSHLPFYFSSINPSINLVWDNHSKIMYGRNESNFFISEIKKKPEFIITKHNVCTSDKSLASVCKEINERYKIRYMLTWAYPFDLYEMKKP
ncbi:hypothetical protein OUR91_001889 [Escherichia coli]|nr:hypothetical protein [Escherichia coli]